jgi:type I restriction enzyme S subunit
MFLINRGELINRVDPYFYKLEFVEIINVIKKNSYTSLKKIGVTIKKGIFDISPELYKQSGIPFLRVADLKQGTINFSNTVFIDEETHGKEIKTEYLPEDLVFSKVGTIGEVSILPNDYDKYNISQNIVGLKLSEEIKKHIYPRFLQIFLSSTYGKRQIIRNSMAGVQPKITLDALRNVLVPVLNLEKQEKVILSIENAENKKKQKETEAAALLASIDGYLLQELGITLPPPSEKKTFFYTPANKVSGGRFDPYCHQSEFEELELALENGRYGIKSFKKLAKKITSGTTPTSGGDDYTSRDLGIPFIRSGEINEFDEIDFDDVIYIKSSVHNKTLKSSQLKKNDLMIAIVGATIGQVGVFKYEFEANINQAIALIRFDNSVNVEYVKSFLKTTIGQKVLDKLKRPVARANINLEEISSIKIALPPPEKQTEIANHISALRTQAKQLQQQAAAELELAKQQVEQLILGE